MQKKGLKTNWNTYTIAWLGVLIAMTIVFSRILAIPVGGFGRFTLGSICTIMAGLWFGPVGGAAAGFTADILGCMLQGYAVNPLITLGAMAWGIIPGLMRPLITGSKRRKVCMLSFSVLLSAITGSLILTYAGLVLILGFNFYAILPTRLVQFAAMTPVYCVLCSLLYFSPLTSMVHHNQRRRARQVSGV